MKKLSRIISLIVIVFLFACKATTFNTRGVQAAMNHYDNLIKKVDADSIALLYTPDGDLGTMAHGRAEIKNFLSGFKNFQVLEQKSQTQSIAISGDSAIHKGIYHQTTKISATDTVRVTGEFTVLWKWVNKEWLIKKFTTKS